MITTILLALGVSAYESQHNRRREVPDTRQFTMIPEPTEWKGVVKNEENGQVIPDECYSYMGEKLKWKDISGGNKFHQVVTNANSDEVWAVLTEVHNSGSGFWIAKYDEASGKWQKEINQEKGVWKNGLIVDSTGEPSYAPDGAKGFFSRKTSKWSFHD